MLKKIFDNIFLWYNRSMNLEAGFGGGRARRTPEEIQEAKDITRKKIEDLNLGTRSTDRTREISEIKMNRFETDLAYNNLANQLIEVETSIAEILKESVKNGGRMDKEARAKMKELKTRKRDIEKEISEKMESNFWKENKDVA